MANQSHNVHGSGSSRVGWSRISLCLAACSLLSLPGPGSSSVARASEPAIDDAWLSSRIVNLDSQDLATRQRVTREIAARADLPLDLIEARLIADTGLSPEQRERLFQVGLSKFIDGPHGALGVSFSGIDRGAGVEIGGVVRGFDAERVLQPGDTVIEIEGRPVNVQLDLRAVILSHKPGEELAMTLMRRGERVAVAVKLGDYASLDRRAVATPSLMRDAWELRVARGAGRANAPRGAIIEPGLDAGQWAKLQLSQDDHRGSSRSRNLGRAEDLDSEMPENVKVAGMGVGGQDRPAAGGDPTFQANASIIEDKALEQVRLDRQQLALRLSRLVTLRDRTPDAATKAMMEIQIRQTQSQIRTLDSILAGQPRDRAPAINRIELRP